METTSPSKAAMRATEAIMVACDDIGNMVNPMDPNVVAAIIDRETAAPDLLAALESVLRVLTIPDKGKGRTAAQQAALDAARAAIRKAKGE